MLLRSSLFPPGLGGHILAQAHTLTPSQRTVTAAQSDKASTSQPHVAKQNKNQRGNQVASSHLPYYSVHWKGCSRGGFGP